MKKYLAISFWVIAAIYLVLVLGFVVKKQNQEICSNVQIIVKDTMQLQFFDNDDILDLLESGGTKVLNEPINKLNIADIEKKIRKIPYVKHADVFKKINGQLVVELEQRIPIVRIFNSKDRSYYIDQEGFLMPTSKKQTARLIVANGNIDYTPDFDTTTNIFNKVFDNSKKIKVLRDIHLLSIFIHSNSFWDAQMQQIYIDNNQEIELVPLVSNQTIIFGTIDNYIEKFKNLEAVYKQGFSVKGWNNYKEINLKFKDQVVCVKSD